ncbi:MAG: ABC transporter permease subunit [Clostridia bacterium]|nr:ABC transporter permease subunit [Clostridia bacterium]
MSIFQTELKRGWIGTVIFGGIISFMLAVCVLIYPEMKGQMDGMSEMFADMGAFSEAFGMDQLDFGTLIGYYGVECGNVLGIGGALFAAFLGIRALSGEEAGRTAEFLLTHPVRRSRVILEKLTAVLTKIAALNLFILLLAALSFLLIGESIPLREFLLIHLAYFILQVEIALLCFGLSGFLRSNGIAIGMGLAMGLYFLNLIANITEAAEFLRYVTPFAYTDAAKIVNDLSVNPGLTVLGLLYGIAVTIGGSIHYVKKDVYA